MTTSTKITAEQMGQIQENAINALRDALKMSLPIWCSTYGHQAIIDRDLLISHIAALNAEIAALKAENIVLQAYVNDYELGRKSALRSINIAASSLTPPT